MKFYPQVYDARFRNDPERGQGDLEERMSGAKPGVGYSILAQILAGPRHKAVITTNFDNLVADALAAYTDTFPLVCGHESLAGFVRTRLRRPLVAKVHRDLLLAPRNTAEETSELDPRWANALRKLLNEFTPVVVGYGGNDGSLMAFLEELQPGTLQGGIYWCYWAPGGVPKERIRRFVARQRGRLVPISDFDEFMLQLNDRFGWPPLTEAMEAKQQEELERYRKAFEQLSQKIRESGPDGRAVRQAWEDTVAREKSWWQWELRAAAQSDPAARDAVYRQGLAQFRQSFELMNNYAIFLKHERKDYDQAEHFYKKALELSPDEARLVRNYANFLTDVRKNHDQAEQLFKKALALDPDHAINVVAYATFLAVVRRDHDEAERLFKKALALDPNDAGTVGNYANFLAIVRRDHEQAGQLYRRALELDPRDPNYPSNHAGLLLQLHQVEEILPLLRRAWQLNQGQPEQVAVEVALYWSLLARCSGKDASPGIGRARYLLEAGYDRGFWSFDPLLEATRPALPAGEDAFFSALASAILDPGRVAALAGFPQWQSATPIPVTEPWDLSL